MSRVGRLLAYGTVAAVLGAALAAPVLAPRDPNALGDDPTRDRRLAPSVQHPLGTDDLSRDVYGRLIHGTRVSVSIALIAAALIVAIAFAWGTTAAFAPAWLRGAMMIFADVVYSVPRLLVVLSVLTFTGQLAPATLAVVLGLAGWAPLSRILYRAAVAARRAPSTESAMALGVGRVRIAFSHVLPALRPHLVEGACMAVAVVIPLEAALTYFGIGVPRPTATWGRLLDDAGADPLGAWWLVVFPSAVIAATVMAMNYLASDARAPRLTAEAK
ncbi:MAG: ABC transporter permease [Gemmatimonadetes bacterium]|nr:ABC transporter permease [Gemmatimonadota bacterium]